ncbi:MAG: hypothetical protein ACLR8Y_17805 [Alistipes indistinctus]
MLLEIVPDQTDAIVSRVVKSYPEQNATDKAVMRGVLGRRDPDVSGPVAGARDRIARFGLVARFRRRVGAHG